MVVTSQNGIIVNGAGGHEIPRQTITLVRHAQARNNVIAIGESNSASMRDPPLTDEGEAQCRSARETIPFLNDVDLLCASPMRRTLETAKLVFEDFLVGKGASAGRKILAVPDAQEATDALSDTGVAVEELKGDFGGIVDFSETGAEWYVHSGSNATDIKTLGERARRLRVWLRKRPERHIVLVSHGNFIHHIYDAINENGKQIGGYWNNLEWRSYQFLDEHDDGAHLEETAESRQQRKGTSDM